MSSVIQRKLNSFAYSSFEAFQWKAYSQWSGARGGKLVQFIFVDVKTITKTLEWRAFV